MVADGSGMGSATLDAMASTASTPTRPGPATAAPDWWRRAGPRCRRRAPGHRRPRRRVAGPDAEARRASSTTSSASARTPGRCTPPLARRASTIGSVSPSRPTGSRRSWPPCAGWARRASRDAVGIDACSPGEVEHALANGWVAGRDLLHRHELLGARPRRHPRRRRASQPRCRQPGRAGRPAGAGLDHRPARQPDDRRRLQRRAGLRRIASDQAGHHRRSAR